MSQIDPAWIKHLCDTCELVFLTKSRGPSKCGQCGGYMQRHYEPDGPQSRYHAPGKSVIEHNPHRDPSASQLPVQKKLKRELEQEREASRQEAAQMVKSAGLDYVSVSQAADIIGTYREAVGRLLTRGAIPYEQDGPKGKRRIARRDLEAYIARELQA